MGDVQEVRKTSFTERLSNLLGAKGKLATLIGFFFSAPANGWALYQLYTGMLVTIEQLYVVLMMNTISIVWFILPSEITIRSGKGLEIVVKD